MPPTADAAHFKGRGVPDVCAVADPETGYIVRGGRDRYGDRRQRARFAPLWAGLIALLNQELGKPLGFLQPALYGTILQHKALNDVVRGTNEAFSANQGWDPCTGLGSPNGKAILSVLKPTA